MNCSVMPPASRPLGWADASVALVRAVTGALLLAAYTAVLCLGVWSTLARSLRSSDVA